MTYRVIVSFRADIFGTFRQSVVFNFGLEPYLRQDLCVDVVPGGDDEGAEEGEGEEDKEEEEDGIKRAAREFQVRFRFNIIRFEYLKKKCTNHKKKVFWAPLFYPLTLLKLYIYIQGSYLI